jgi:hypothetical protein
MARSPLRLSLCRRALGWGTRRRQPRVRAIFIHSDTPLKLQTASVTQSMSSPLPLPLEALLLAQRPSAQGPIAAPCGEHTAGGGGVEGGLGKVSRRGLGLLWQRLAHPASSSGEEWNATQGGEASPRRELRRGARDTITGLIGEARQSRKPGAGTRKWPALFSPEVHGDSRISRLRSGLYAARAPPSPPRRENPGECKAASRLRPSLSAPPSTHALVPRGSRRVRAGGWGGWREEQGGWLEKAGSRRRESKSILHYGDDRGASLGWSIHLFVIRDLLGMATMTVPPKSFIIRREAP